MLDILTDGINMRSISHCIYIPIGRTDVLFSFFDQKICNEIVDFFIVKVKNANENDDINLTANLKPKTSPFQGIISQCFEDHLDIYISEIDR